MLEHINFFCILYALRREIPIFCVLVLVWILWSCFPPCKIQFSEEQIFNCKIHFHPLLENLKNSKKKKPNQMLLVIWLWPYEEKEFDRWHRYLCTVLIKTRIYFVLIQRCAALLLIGGKKLETIGIGKKNPE